MYLIFRSKNAAVTKSTVYGVEVVMTKPTYITAASDLVYVDLSSMTDDAADTYVRRIYNNIDKITLNVQVNSTTNIGTGKIIFPTVEATTRKIDTSAWKSCAPMAWARLTGTANLFNL